VMPPSNLLTTRVVDEDVQSEQRVMSPAPGSDLGTVAGPG